MNRHDHFLASLESLSACKKKKNMYKNNKEISFHPTENSYFATILQKIIFIGLKEEATKIVIEKYEQ